MSEQEAKVEAGSFTVSEIYKEPELSEWTCYLFGGQPNVYCITWRPEKGKHPNWFWRKMQYLIVGNYWIKDR